MKRFYVGIVLSTFAFFVCMTTYPLVSIASGYGGEANTIVTADLSGVVGLSMENFIIRVLDHAAERNASLILFRIDTPGGLVSSMREITRSILDSKVPIAVWVAPRGSRAASAGAFIVQSAPIAAMAPGTNIGAAHPVSASGGNVGDDEMNRKVTNDLAAQIRSLAQLHGRNSENCAKMVTESISMTAEEAMNSGVIDLVESDITTLLKDIDGKTLFVDGEKKVLSLHGGYELEAVKMTPREKTLHFISSPTVAYLLLTIGIYAIILEVLSPGGFMMGTAGAVMVLLGSYGLRMLPVNWAGIILLVAGIVVMVLDLFVGGIGLLSLFGMAALVVGSMVVFRAPGGELLNVSLNVIIGGVAAISVFSLIAAALVLRTLRKKASSGKEGLIGLTVKAIEDIAPEGMVRCRGEIWKAIIADGILKDGELGKVVDVKGLVLVIEPFVKNKKLEEASDDAENDF